MEVSFEGEFTAIELFEFGEEAIAHRRDFERVDDGEGGFFSHNFTIRAVSGPQEWIWVGMPADEVV